MSNEINESLGLEEKSQKSPNRNNTKAEEDNKPSQIFAFIFYSLAGILAIVGLILTYQDSNYDTEIVGGDAYNYIIFATRGVVWIGAAILSSILGLACQLLSFKRELLNDN